MYARCVLLVSTGNAVAQTSCIECPAGRYEEHGGRSSCTKRVLAAGTPMTDGLRAAHAVLVSTLLWEQITAVCVSCWSHR